MCRNKALVFLALVKIQEVSFCVSKNQQKSISATLKTECKCIILKYSNLIIFYREYNSKE